MQIKPLLKTFLKRCREYPLTTSITVAVTFLHLLLIGILIREPNCYKKPLISKRVTVQTVRLSPPPKPSKPLQPVVKREEKPVINSSVKKKKSSQPTKKKKVVEERKAQPFVDKKLIKLAQESLQKVVKNQIADNQLVRGELPEKISLLCVDQSPIDSVERGYIDQLITKLQIGICLPEKGEVKIALTVDRGGEILNLKVLSSYSSINSRYLEGGTSTLQLPPFADAFKGEKSHRFEILLRGG